jgi:glycosyltransferase involved in cell wall biosynthesis
MSQKYYSIRENKVFLKKIPVFFSIVIPLYNKEKFVAATLESILAQTFTDYEVIVVDDVSTDGSVDVVEKISGKFPPDFRIISHQKNSGLSAARNTGIRNAGSDLIAFIDADDVWKPDFLEKMHELVHRFPEAGIYASGYEEKYPAGLALNTHKNLDFKAGEMNLVPDFFDANAHQPIFWYGSAVVRREVFDTVGVFDQSITYGEDTDFNIRAGQQFKLAYYNAVCSSYTMDSENQITRSSLNDKVITDFKKYEPDAIKNPSLKRFLDFNRYILAIEYKLIGNAEKFTGLVSEINSENLTKRQKFLLNAPVTVIKFLRKVKRAFLKKGVRLTTFKK